MGNWETSTPLYFQSQYHFLFFNYACDRLFIESSPFLWKLLKILFLFLFGLRSKTGEFLGMNTIGFRPYIKEIKFIISIKKTKIL